MTHQKGKNREDQLRIEAQVWAYRTQNGMTHARIAELTGMERSGVTRMLQRLSRRVTEKLNDEIVEERIAQLEVHRKIVDEAIQAWERSKNPARTVTQRTPTDGQQPEPQEEQPEQPRRRGRPRGGSGYTMIRAENQEGDPRYLSSAMDAMERIRKILGMDQNTNFNIELNQLSDEQIDRIAKGEDVKSVLATPSAGREDTKAASASGGRGSRPAANARSG